MTWFSILCLVFLAAFARVSSTNHANVENAEYVELNIHRFANLSDERIPSFPKTPNEFKYDYYNNMANVIKNLDADLVSYSVTAMRKVNTSDQFYEKLSSCHEMFDQALYNQYLESRKHILNAFESFKNYTDSRSLNKSTIPKEEPLKLNLNATDSKCHGKKQYENGTNSCQHNILSELIAKVGQYSTENDELYVEVVTFQKEMDHALENFYTFASMEIIFFEMCQDITIPKENKTESPFDNLINALMTNITNDGKNILQIQEDGIEVLVQFRNDGIDVVSETRDNLTQVINNTLTMYKSNVPNQKNCTEFLQKRIFDAYAKAQKEIEDTHIMINASLSLKTSLVLQAGKELNSALKALLKTKRQLTDEKRLNFSKELVTLIKEIVKYDLSKLNLSLYEFHAKTQIVKALDRFHQEIFEAYKLQGICLKSHNFESLFSNKTLKVRSFDKNRMMDYIDDLINRTVITETAVKQDYRKHNYDSLSYYYNSLSSITKQQLDYRRYNSDVYLPCLTASRNKTNEAFSRLIVHNNNILRSDYLATDDKLKKLLHGLKNLQFRLNDIERECLEEWENATCLTRKIREIGSQIEGLDRNFDQLKKISLRLQNHYTKDLHRFVNEERAITDEISICVKQSLKNSSRN